MLTGRRGGTQHCKASLHHGAREDKPCSLWMHGTSLAARGAEPAQECLSSHLQALWEAAWANPGFPAVFVKLGSKGLFHPASV